VNKLIGVFMLSLVFSGWAGEAAAQYISNGYECAPKNIGGEDTRLYFRQQDGGAINISKTATFPVVCPVFIDYYFFEGLYGVGVTLRNGSKTSQTFQCALEEYRVDGVKARSIGRSLTIAAGDWDVISYEPMVVTQYFNYSSIRCILPPGGSIAELAWF